MQLRRLQTQVVLIDTEYEQARLGAYWNELLAREGQPAGPDLELGCSNAELLDNRRRIEKGRREVGA